MCNSSQRFLYKKLEATIPLNSLAFLAHKGTACFLHDRRLESYTGEFQGQQVESPVVCWRPLIVGRAAGQSCCHFVSCNCGSLKLPMVGIFKIGKCCKKIFRTKMLPSLLYWEQSGKSKYWYLRPPCSVSPFRVQLACHFYAGK